MKKTISTFIINEILNEPKAIIDGDIDLLNSGLIDSIGMMKVVFFIEKEFDIHVHNDDLTPNNFKNIDAICTYISSTKSTA